MRVAFVLSGLGAGGAEKVVNLLAHHRVTQGDTVHVIAVNAATDHSYFAYHRDVVLHAIGSESGARAGRLWSSALALRRRLAKIQPDVVISFLSKINVLVGLTTIGLGIPIVMSERNNYQVQTMSPFWRVLMPLTARRASCLVMQTDAARRALPYHLRASAVVIPNPVSLPVAFERRVSAVPRFVAAGRLEEQKGFDLLIAAFSHVVQSLPAASLTIFGEGPERKALERQVQDLGLRERVLLPGVTKTPSDWLSPGDIFVLSSRFEGFPNVLLEALMGGMAAVAFDCPWGPSEILHGDAGLLVPPGDVRQLADTLVRVATDAELRRRLVDLGPQVAARYSKPAVFGYWDEVIAKAAARYRPLTARGEGRAEPCRSGP